MFVSCSLDYIKREVINEFRPSTLLTKEMITENPKRYLNPFGKGDYYEALEAAALNTSPSSKILQTKIYVLYKKYVNVRFVVVSGLYYFII